MRIKFAKGLVVNGIYDYISENSFKQLVRFIIDSDTRDSVLLKYWLMIQDVENDEAVINAAKEIPNSDNYDTQVRHVQSWVINNIVYAGDKQTWNRREKFATARETLTRWYVRKGDKLKLVATQIAKPNINGCFRAEDCDGGAVLTWALCVAKGVPRNRLMIQVGHVEAAEGAISGGHAWCAYRPQQYPLNFAFIDWCYFPDRKSMNSRVLYTINGQNIRCHDKENNKVESLYKKIWFVFNDEWSSRKIDIKIPI